MYNSKPQKRKHSESLRSPESVKIKTKKELSDHSPSSSEGQTDSSLSPYFSSPLSIKEIVYESSLRVLYVSIQWVKHIPTFKDLPYNDQNLLIHQGWGEVFILGMIDVYRILLRPFSCNMTTVKILKALAMSSQLGVEISHIQTYVKFITLNV